MPLLRSTYSKSFIRIALSSAKNIVENVELPAANSTLKWNGKRKRTTTFAAHHKSNVMTGETMRFMIIVKATQESEAGVMPPKGLFAAMATYHEELAKAGILLDASGLQPSSKGWRVKYSGSKRTIIDGPFSEAKELIAGYTMIQVKTREEAVEWSRRFPNPAGEGIDTEIEVRQFFEMEDFEVNEETDRFRKLDAEQRSKA